MKTGGTGLRLTRVNHSMLYECYDHLRLRHSHTIVYVFYAMNVCKPNSLLWMRFDCKGGRSNGHWLLGRSL